jgi:hypothetical protein
MNRRTIQLLILAGLLAISALWSYRKMAGQQQAAKLAAADLAECRKAADQIEALRRRPALAQQNQRESAETIGLIEKSAKAAGLTEAMLVRTVPEQPLRLGDTVYLEKPTRVQLKNVSLVQLVEMVYRIVTDKNHLHAKAMRISAPSAEDTGAQWNVELVLTYLIYEPQKTQK